MPDWRLVEVKRECTGSTVNFGKQSDVSECAGKCKGSASMFTFGTNDYGTARCDNSGCDCYCMKAASNTGSCDQHFHSGYRLYGYNSKGKYFCCIRVEYKMHHILKTKS